MEIPLNVLNVKKKAKPSNRHHETADKYDLACSKATNIQDVTADRSLSTKRFSAPTERRSTAGAELDDKGPFLDRGEKSNRRPPTGKNYYKKKVQRQRRNPARGPN